MQVAVASPGGGAGQAHRHGGHGGGPGLPGHQVPVGEVAQQRRWGEVRRDGGGATRLWLGTLTGSGPQQSGKKGNASENAALENGKTKLWGEGCANPVAVGLFHNLFDACKIIKHRVSKFCEFHKYYMLQHLCYIGATFPS